MTISMNHVAAVDQTIKDLEATIDVLQTNAWGQGKEYDPETRAFCAFGAIRCATGGLDISFGPTEHLVVMDNPVFEWRAHGKDSKQYQRAVNLRDRASNVSRAFYRIIGTDPTVYNDTEGRTKDQVIRAMRTVLNSLRENPNRA